MTDKTLYILEAEFSFKTTININNSTENIIIFIILSTSCSAHNKQHLLLVNLFYCAFSVKNNIKTYAPAENKFELFPKPRKFINYARILNLLLKPTLSYNFKEK